MPSLLAPSCYCLPVPLSSATATPQAQARLLRPLNRGHSLSGVPFLDVVVRILYLLKARPEGGRRRDGA